MFLILGHSRGGTAYMAKLMQALGFDVRHERYGRDGMSSWIATVRDNDPPWPSDPRRPCEHRIIHAIRDPLTALPSILATDFGPITNGYKKRYIDFPIARTFEAVAHSYLLWHELIELQNPEFTVRIEDAAVTLPAYLGVPPVPDPGPQNCKPHPRFSPVQITQALEPETRRSLSEYAKTHGYWWPA